MLDLRFVLDKHGVLQRLFAFESNDYAMRRIVNVRLHNRQRIRITIDVDDDPATTALITKPRSDTASGVTCRAQWSIVHASCGHRRRSWIPCRKSSRCGPERETATLQHLPYFVGLSASTVDARGLSMHLVVVPPGAHGEAHLHVGYETGIYVLGGRVETRHGLGLCESIGSEAGIFSSFRRTCRISRSI